MNIDRQPTSVTAYIRLSIAISCVLITGLSFFGIGSLTLFLAAQIMFALSLPRGYQSFYGVAFYGICWGVIWLLTQHEIAIDPHADERGTTRAVFLIANLSFLLGLGLSYFVQALAKSWRWSRNRKRPIC